MKINLVNGLEKIRNFFLDILFPKFCFGCQKEEVLLCQDCQAVLDINRSHQKYSTKNLSDLYFALPYQKVLIKNLIQKFKYEPFLKELSKPLAYLILEHLQLVKEDKSSFSPFAAARVTEEKNNLSDFIVVPIPLEKKRLKWRGFNQAEEIGKEISKFLNIPLMNGVLIKIKENSLQVDLSEKERKENVREVFGLKDGERIFGKKILLIDDVYTTGATLEEAARVLKENGAEKIIGMVIARAEPGQDF